MAKSYVKFEVSKDVAGKIAETLRLAKQSGTIRKGANEVTKSVERGLANFVVIAEDVDPEEVVMHIPKLCESKKIAFAYLPTKLDLGKAIGINVPCAAAAIEKPGEAERPMKDVIAKLTGKSAGAEKAAEPAKPAAATAAAPAAAAKPAQHKPKKEAPAAGAAPAPEAKQ